MYCSSVRTKFDENYSKILFIEVKICKEYKIQYNMIHNQNDKNKRTWKQLLSFFLKLQNRFEKFPVPG